MIVTAGDMLQDLLHGVSHGHLILLRAIAVAERNRSGVAILTTGDEDERRT